MTTNNNKKDYAFRKAFESETNLQKYGCSALSLFALSLYLRIEDIEEFAVNFITEGGNDKKVDICYLDEESKNLFIVQNYVAENWNKKSAPDKASDLNTAIAWLFSASIVNVPVGLQAKAIEIRKAIEEENINHIELLYIHNCPESKNISSELKTAADLLKDILLTLTQGTKNNIEISNREIGINEIESLYKSRDSQIVIDDWLEVPKDSNYLIENTEKWNAVLTTVPASWIRDLYQKHGDDLFSANYRGYLGSNKKEENINNQIAKTANTEPENFWVFNNGITALTHDIKFTSRSRKIMGISIINGAQTSGALGSTILASATKAKVLLRIISCFSSYSIDNIIQYNNTQNEIKPEDRRSKDQRQIQIQDDFAKYSIDYYYRRSTRKVTRTTITGKSLAPSLCAFHGDPDTAFRNPRKIYKDDETYEKVFPNNIKVEHMFLVRSLSLAIDQIKQDLENRMASGTATVQESKQYQLLRFTASKHFLFYVVGFIAEEIMKTKITNLYDWRCKPELLIIDNVSLIDSWKKVLQALLPQIIRKFEQVGPDSFYEIPRSTRLTREVTLDLKSIIASLESSFRSQFIDLRKRSVI
ncbi:MAG: hypothetical protein FP831_15910 [Anaerolineae bacterium]|nr:hypothetical protein [Anaerolineae bacterium]